MWETRNIPDPVSKPSITRVPGGLIVRLKPADSAGFALYVPFEKAG
jgi:hypothetical protein